MNIDLNRKFPRPEGHHSITAGFAVPNAGKVIDFLERAFGGKVLGRWDDAKSGVVMHAEVKLGDSVVMMGDANKEHGMPAMPASLSYYVENGEAVDTTYKRALAAGATSLEEPQNKFYGYRSACVKDVGGNRWTICAIVEQVTNEEMERRMKDFK